MGRQRGRGTAVHTKYRHGVGKAGAHDRTGVQRAEGAEKRIEVHALRTTFRGTPLWDTHPCPDDCASRAALPRKFCEGFCARGRSCNTHGDAAGRRLSLLGGRLGSPINERIEADVWVASTWVRVHRVQLLKRRKPPLRRRSPTDKLWRREVRNEAGPNSRYCFAQPMPLTTRRALPHLYINQAARGCFEAVVEVAITERICTCASLLEEAEYLVRNLFWILPVGVCRSHPLRLVNGLDGSKRALPIDVGLLEPPSRVVRGNGRNDGNQQQQPPSSPSSALLNDDGLRTSSRSGGRDGGEKFRYQSASSAMTLLRGGRA
jgi:hypothetical protein